MKPTIPGRTEWSDVSDEIELREVTDTETNVIRKAIRWLEDFARQHSWVNWIFHGIGMLLIMLPFALAGDPKLGAWVGFSIYFWRELEDVFTRWTRMDGVFKITRDNVGDSTGPVLIFVAAMVLL